VLVHALVDDLAAGGAHRRIENLFLELRMDLEREALRAYECLPGFGDAPMS